MCDVTKVKWVEHGDEAQVSHPSIDVRPAGTVADLYSRKDENSTGYEPFQASSFGRGGAGAGARSGWKRGEGDKTSQNATAAASPSSKPAPSTSKAPKSGGNTEAGGGKSGGKFDETSSFSGNVLRLLKLNSPAMPKVHRVEARTHARTPS